MNKKIKKRLIFYPVFYIIICLILFLSQRSLIYHPTEPIKHSFETINLTIDNIEAEIIKLNSNNDRAIVYFGGNAEVIAYTSLNLRLQFPDHTIYLLNYPGFGNSTGKPTEARIYMFAQKLFTKIKKQHDSVVVMGRSLGTGVATFLASENNIEKLVLITPFDSLARIAQDKLFIFPIKYLIIDNYDSINRANLIISKTLILIAENDTIIPFENSMNLVHSLDPQISLVKIISEANHNNISDSEDFYSEIKEFIN